MKIKIWKVSQISAYLRDIVDNDIVMRSFFAEGEISNLKSHPSGHIYFSLKDSKSSINCVMFKTYAESLGMDLKNGMKVITCGYISVYEKTCQIQFYAELIEPVGRGGLYTELEALKNKLYKEGLFDETKKKPLPYYPKCIGIITSKAGAAFRDIVNVIKRRNKNIKIVLWPVLVQGENAPAEIVSAIKNMNAWGKADVIILGRGGGSAEDLWAFNDELVARAIYDSNIPIISAVGHEIDFTIADLTADLRAATPSAAAELAVPELNLIKSQHDNLKATMNELLVEKIYYYRGQLNLLLSKKIMQKPWQILNIKKKAIIDLYKEMNKFIDYKMTLAQSDLRTEIKSLENMSPLKVIGRGYALAMDGNGKVIEDASKININDEINLRFRDGYISANVTAKRVENDNGKK